MPFVADCRLLTVVRCWLLVCCWGLGMRNEECASTVENESRTTTFGDPVRSVASESRLVAAQSAVQAENHSGIAKVIWLLYAGTHPNTQRRRMK